MMTATVVCPLCGRGSPQGVAECGNCGFQALLPAELAEASPASEVQTGAPAAVAKAALGAAPTPKRGPAAAFVVDPPEVLPPSQAPVQPARRDTKELEGTVLAIQQLAMEAPRDWPMLVSQVLLLLGVMVCPVLLLVVVATASGPGSLILGFLGLLALLRLLGTADLLSLLGLVHLFRGGGGRDTPDVTVTALTLRSEAGDRALVRLEGALVHASISVGDTVTLQGRWNDGVFFARGGRIHDAGNARIQMHRRRPSWVTLGLVLGAYAVVVYYTYPYLAELGEIARARHWSGAWLLP